MPWLELGEWWIEELADDPAYETVITPLLLEVLVPEDGRRYLDLGSGEGRVMRAVVARLHELPVADRVADGVYPVPVNEHNLDVIKTVDHVIDLGPEGGSGGGRIVAEGTPEAVAQVRESYTGKFLREIIGV